MYVFGGESRQTFCLSSMTSCRVCNNQLLCRGSVSLLWTEASVGGEGTQAQLPSFVGCVVVDGMPSAFDLL